MGTDWTWVAKSDPKVIAARIDKLENGLRDVVENCTLANQSHANSCSYRAIGLLAAKALSNAS